MARFDRYVLSQLLWLFGFFSLVLVLVYWVNRAVRLFDQLIANGHSALVFLEFTALALPNVIRLVLPVSGFVATLYVTNRLSSESELTAVQATGYSPWRLARAPMVFGLFAAVLISLLTHVLVPLSLGRLDARTDEISENATARLLSEGEFLHPSDGTTFYVRQITADGELLDIFLSDTRTEARQVTYTAARALLLRHDEGPRLVMFDGMAQVFDAGADTLSVTHFKDFVFNIGAILDTGTEGARSIREVPTLELITRADAVSEELGRSRASIAYEAQSRFSQALKGAIAPLLGFSFLMLGGFSRFGLWRQIVAAIFALIIFEGLDSTAGDLVRRGVLPWPAGFLPAAVAAAAVAGVLAWASRPRTLRRGVAA